MVWIVFTAVVLLIFLADLAVGHQNRGRLSTPISLLLCLIPILLAIGYGLWLSAAYDARWFGLVAGPTGHEPLLEYMTGYLLELSLSADNVMMFVLLLRTFSVPPAQQGFVLFWGILAALALRAGLIFSGLALILKIHAIFYIMGGILLVAGVLMFFERDEERQLGQWLSRALRAVLPIHDQFEGRKLVVRRNGRLYATPLLVVMLLVGIVDVIFAFDSIPAIFGITQNPVIVVTSNLFAVMALHWLYFVLAPLVERLKYLKIGLAIILLFIGFKMLLPLSDLLGYSGPVDIPVRWSLAFMAVVLVIAIVSSLRAESSRHELNGAEGPEK